MQKSVILIESNCEYFNALIEYIYGLYIKKSHYPITLPAYKESTIHISYLSNVTNN